MNKLLKLTLLSAMVLSQFTYTSKATTNQVNFDLHSTVYNYGEAIDQVSIDVSDLDLDETCLTTKTFTVLATAKTPYEHLEVLKEDGLVHCGQYENVPRTIEQITYQDGKIILDLETTKDTAGKGTIDFTANFTTFKGCNLSLDITYTINLETPLVLKDGSTIETLTFNQQPNIINDEISKFEAGNACGLKYQMYSPVKDNQKHPLIVWFHGGGESGYKGETYDELYNNMSQLQANRGSVAFTTKEAQDIFGNAYVLCPQTPNEWSDSIDEATALIHKIIEENDIDPTRIYAFGCSAGGYMALDMVVHNPDLFAAVVATCPAIDEANIARYGEGRIITDEELEAIDIPMWVIQATNDTTVSYDESAGRISNILKDRVILSKYDSVEVDGDVYSGHEAWVYTALNMPEHEGVHVWQWCASQAREVIETPIIPTVGLKNNGIYLAMSSLALLSLYVASKKKKED